MPKKNPQPRSVAELIDVLLKERDPAVIGLRSILKKKADSGKDFPLQQYALEELHVSEEKGESKLFSENEQRVMLLEKEIIELKQKLEKQQKQTERAIRDTHATGFEEGLKKGEEKGYAAAKSNYDQQIQQFHRHLQQVLGGIKESRRKLLAEAHHGVLELAVLIARKIVNTEISLNKEIILSVIKKVLSHIADRQSYIVRVSSTDLETVLGKKDFWTSISDRVDHISVEPDARIEAGGCIIESSNGAADARINIQFQEIVDHIEEVWNSTVFLPSDK